MIDTLFQKRVKAMKKQKQLVQKTMLDWTILLYMIIPGSIFIVFQYVEWIRQIEVWGHIISPFFLAIALTFYAQFFSSYLYIEEADTVFLLQNKNILTTLKKKSIRLAIRKSFIISLVAFLPLSPIFLHNNPIGWGFLIQTFFFLWLMQILQTWINYYIPIFFVRKLKQILVAFLAFIALVCLYFLYFYVLKYATFISGVFIILLLVMLVFCQKIILSNKYTLQEITKSEQERMRLTVFVLKQSGTYKRTQISSRPYFNWYPSFLSKKNAMILNFYIRDWSYLSFFIKMTSVCFVALLLVPLWTQIIILAFYGFFIQNEVTRIKEKFYDHPFMKIQSAQSNHI